MSAVTSSRARASVPIETSYRYVRRDSLIAAALTALMSSCGFITAGAASAASDDSTASNAPAAITGFAVEDAKTEPAAIRFVLADAEGDSVEVELFYEVDPDGTGPSPLVSGKLEHLFERRPAPPANPTPTSAALGNPLVLAASPQGTEHVFDWFFTREAGIGSAGFTPDVFVFAQVTGGVQSLTPGANAARLGVGNDPPVIVDADEDGFADADVPSEEVVGLAHVSFLVKDSSLDQVDVRVEYAIADGLDVDAGELPTASAYSTATAEGEPLTSIQVTKDGTQVDFFWDALADLGRTEHDVVLRLTPDDRTVGALDPPIGVGQPVVTRAFRIDNNAAPITQFDEGLFVLNPDERRGIPIPCRVIDAESDQVDVIFQWRRNGETFPELPTDGAALDAIRADPLLRRELRVCTPFPRYARGGAIPVDSLSVRVPELAASEAWILTAGLVGGTLELLRPPAAFAPLASSWSVNPLASPIAALPFGDGLTALVLDAPGGAGRVREIELATGQVVREIAALGAGAPTAMAFERGEDAVLVASDFGGPWAIDRIDLASGAVTELCASSPSDEPAPVRALESLGTSAAALTAGSTLYFLDYRDALAPRLGSVLTGLAAPWGLAVDPIDADRLYLAERDAPTALGTGRVLAVDLDTHGARPVAVKTVSLAPGSLAQPESLAFERDGPRLLVVTKDAIGGRQIVGLDLGARGGNRVFPLGAAQPGAISSVSSGAEGLLLACLPASNDLLVAGGIEQRRTIDAYDPDGHRIRVAQAFEPLPTAGQSCRLEPGRPRATPTGVKTSFAWDTSADLPGGGTVFLRALAKDVESGAAVVGTAPKRVRGALDVAPLVLPTTNPSSVLPADLDGDGDFDFVSRSGPSWVAFYQNAPGSFVGAPLTLVPKGTLSSITDMDGDGDGDLVAITDSDTLTVYFQTAPGSFVPTALAIGDSSTIDGPFAVASADLDGDGDLDLVSANAQSDTLTVFFQSTPGSFDPVPLTLDGPGATPGTIESLRTVASADLDGDGDLDLVSANGVGLTVFFQGARGSFDASPLTIAAPLSISGTGVLVVAPTDFDGDGDTDVVSPSGGGLIVFHQNAPGSFDPVPLSFVPPGTLHAIADLDADHDLDLVYASSNTLAILFQDAPGSFDPTPLTLGGPATTNSPIAVAAADLDGDGHADLVSANLLSGNLTIFLQNSPGTFDLAPLTLDGVGAQGQLGLEAADLDEDGDLDLLSTNPSNDAVMVFFQTAPGMFAPTPLAIGSPSTTDAPTRAVPADLDGDGDLDLAVTNGGSDTLAVFFQTAPGSFGRTPLVLGGPATTNGTNALVAADADGDGDLDLVSANWDEGNLTVFLQSGPGSFDPIPLEVPVPGFFGFPSFPNAVGAADLDGDGDLDLVAGSAQLPKLVVLLRNSSGGFDPASFTLALGGGGGPFNNNLVCLTPADADGDGDLDLVAGNSGGDKLNVFFQGARGTFGPAPLKLDIPGSIDLPAAVAAADLDENGAVDLVSANHGSDTITIFFQGAPGRFDAAPFTLGSSQITDGPRSLQLTDLDGDGDQDIVAASEVSNTITVFFGRRQ